MGSIDAAPIIASGHEIIDIRSDSAGFELKKEIFAGLRGDNGKAKTEKTLPTLLLYDDRGLKLFERITYLEQYYLTNAEIAVLEQHSDSIAQRIPDNAMIVELGSGNLRKVNILLQALERARKHVDYFALDLMKSELERTLSDVPSYQHVKVSGLWGTYDDGLAYLQTPANTAKPKLILSLGSSIGNFTREDAVAFIDQFAAILGPNDAFLVGLDACQDPRRVFHAYNDRDGVTHAFTMNGLRHANRLLGYEAFRDGEWEAVGEYDAVGGRHRAFVAPTKDVVLDGLAIRQGEKIRIEESYKYSAAQSDALWSAAGVTAGTAWSNDGNHALHLLNRPNMMCSTNPEQYAAHPVPSLDDWHHLWSAWDVVTQQMIPTGERLSKPIKLRNPCLFYMGHIPTFFDMKIVEATGGKPTEPSYFQRIFERGIDPDVDDPEQCHAHSELPDEWPSLETILTYQERVRDRLTGMYTSGQVYDEPWAGRAVWLGYEHEALHLETLLYMLLQSDKTLPPAGTIKPDFEQLAAQAKRSAVENEWFDIPAQTVEMGLNDPDNADGPLRHFGWDIEKPPRSVNVCSFKAKARPITNGEYARYLLATSKTHLPASWASASETSEAVVVNGHSAEDAFLLFVKDKTVRTVYGLVPLELALDWPISASYDELTGCAKYMGGRIPTVEETRSIYVYADMLKKELAANAIGKTIPAVNGHLVNEGVQESPPHVLSLNGHASAVAGLDPNDLFVNLDHANVGFKHWHPMPVTPYGGRLAGQGEMGGVWEWTSSPLTKPESFEPMKLYPAYSADFFDDKHNIVLGGSWATYPRIAGRKTFVNWYQRNYPFVWAGARLVKDA